MRCFLCAAGLVWCTLMPTIGLPSTHAATAPVYAGLMRVLTRRLRGGCGDSPSSFAQMLPETAACARNKHLVPEIAASSGEIEGVIDGDGVGAPESADAGAETPMREMLRRLHTLRVDAESNVSASSAVLEEEEPSEAVTQVSIIITSFVCAHPCLCSAFASSNVQQVFDSSYPASPSLFPHTNFPTCIVGHPGHAAAEGFSPTSPRPRRRRAPTGSDQSHADKERGVSSHPIPSPPSRISKHSPLVRCTLCFFFARFSIK